MKRVLLVIPNLDFGGAQNSFARVSQLIGPHCELLLVVFNKDNIAPLNFGAPLVDLDVSGAGFLFNKITNFARRVSRLKKIKKEFKPDVSVSFLEGADYVNLFSSVGETILFYLHGSKKHDKNINGWLGWMRKELFIPYFYKKANGILVVNDQLKYELITSFGLSKSIFYFVPNFCDVQELQQAATEEVSSFFTSLYNCSPTIVIAGRLAHEKGIDRFISILGAVLKKESTVKLILVGEGPLREAIVERCKAEGINYSVGPIHEDENASVFFAGFQKNPYKFMKRATFLALPSSNEGMPNAIMESLCLGVPVIASDCPYGPRELLTETARKQNAWPEYAENGILVPVPDSVPGTTEAWVEAILKMISDKSLQTKYSLAGFEKSKSFSRQEVLAKWLMLVNGNS